MPFDSFRLTSSRTSTVTPGIAPTKRCDSCKDAPYVQGKVWRNTRRHRLPTRPQERSGLPLGSKTDSGPGAQ